MVRLSLILIMIISLMACGGPTKVVYQELPKEKPLAIKIDGVTFRVVSFGTTGDWSELEIAVANETGGDIHFDASKIYLTNEKDYDLMPLSSYEINDRVRRKTGKWITPLTIAAAVAGIGAIVAPSSKDTDSLARAALGLVGAAAVGEVAKQQSAEADQYRKEDLLLKSYRIPPKLQVGGVLYYRATESAKGVKAFINVNGREEFFQIRF